MTRVRLGASAPLACLITFAALTASAAEPAPGRLELVFETESAHATLDVLTGNAAPTEEVLARVAALAGNHALIHQAESFRPAWSEASFREDLGKAARGEPLGEDVWAFGLVKERLEPTRRLLADLEADPSAFATPVVARLSAFLPPGESVRVVVHFAVGGSSDGFAPGDGDFYIALHYFRGDADGLRLLMSHELFHVLLRRLAPKQKAGPATPAEKARALLDQTMNEGVASWIGDATRAPGDGPYLAWFAQKFKRNLARLDQNTALFDSLLFRLFHDPAATNDALHPIGFGGLWDSPLYFVGYAMASYLEKTEGSAAVAAAVRAGPVSFFRRYLAAAKAHGNAPVTFSASTQAILSKLGG